MNDEQSVEVAMWTLVIVQTIGSVDMPGNGPRKMPAPRAYVPLVVVYGLLGILADAGQGRIAKVLAWLNVLVAMVLGPFGSRFISFLNTVTSQFRPVTFTGG